MPAPPRTPAENFATLLAWLSQAVAAMSGGDRLSCALIGLIIDRIRCIKQRFARLAARIREGRYAVRIVAPHRRAEVPRRPDPLPKTFGWLLKLVPEAVQYRGQLENLLRDPDMAALLAAAPASLGRPLRSLCHMLGLPRPEILAPPAKPRPPREKAPPPAPAGEQASEAADRPARKPARTTPSPRVRYVFGLRYPPPLPDPA
jgi:hypothetical protein